MAKTKAKAKPVAKKKTTSTAKAKPNRNTKKSAILRKPTTSKGKASAKSPDDVFVHWMIEKIVEMTDDFVAEHDSDSALTGTERMRLIGAGVRNYGAHTSTAKAVYMSKIIKAWRTTKANNTSKGAKALA